MTNAPKTTDVATNAPKTTDCGDDALWAAYLAGNPALAGFPHLRPEGSHALPTVRAPPRNKFTVVLAGPDGLSLAPVLKSLTRRSRKRKREGPVKALDYHVGMTVGDAGTVRFVTWTVASPLYRWAALPGSVYSKMPATDETKLTALRELAAFFSRGRVRLVRFPGAFAATAVDWMIRNPKARVAAYHAHCVETDAFYGSFSAPDYETVQVNLAPGSEDEELSAVELEKRILVAVVDEYVRDVRRELPDMKAPEMSINFFTQVKR